MKEKVELNIVDSNGDVFILVVYDGVRCGKVWYLIIGFGVVIGEFIGDVFDYGVRFICCCKCEIVELNVVLYNCRKKL